SSVKDMGKVMGLLKQRFTGQMDFALASTAVKEILLNQ
ncbi:MAG: GatB/YqeY domain-containing protein, partial [Pseudomonadota bacterium]|nr:GatB/YqeY domain-containing protein [Pseudomonadota bacterium]